jgi:CBS domain-containing protein
MDPVFRRILSAVDFDPNSLGALDFAAKLARHNHARVFLLHVIPTPLEPGNVPPYTDVYLGEENRAQELSRIARRHLEKIEHEVMVRSGDPATCILDAAEEVSAELIVLAAYRSTGHPRRFIGSVAATIVGEAQCAVLTVRPSWHGAIDTVGAQMTKDPVTIGPQATLAEAYEAMKRGRFHMIPVVENDRLVGLVTDRDVRSRIGELEQTLVRSVMAEAVITVTPGTSIRQAARTMVECEIGGMPVIENGRVIGVITTTDALKALLR